MNDQAASPDACAEPTAGLLSVDEARARVQALATPVTEHERLPIRSALGRVLAEDIRSALDVPPFDNSAMDGYAVRAADLPAAGETTLAVAGKSMAGAPFAGEVGPGQAVRIMTGAVMPAGADTVIMQEHVQQADDGSVRIGAGHKPGRNVRHAGEDIRRGDTVLRRGTRLGPAELGVLASIGVPEVSVFRRVRVAFFSTGDELRPVGSPLGPGQIHDSNRYTLYGMLTRLGVEVLDLGAIPDDLHATRETVAAAARAGDVIITAGGVSVGEADYVTRILRELGKLDFWRMAMKPGKPLAVGRVDRALFFGLPGNPVSAMVTFMQFVQPALRVLSGEPPRKPLLLRARCSGGLKKRPGRLEFQRAIIASAPEGALTVTATGGQDSHLLTSMSRANCFVILPAESAGVADGDEVLVQPFCDFVW